MVNTRKEFEKIKTNKTYGYSNFIQQQIRSKGVWDYKVQYIKTEKKGRPKITFLMHQEDWNKVKEALI